MSKSKILAAAAGFMLVAGVAWAAGIYPQFPTVFPVGTTGSQTVNGVSIGTSYAVLPLTGNELVAADTGLSGGRAPQTEVINLNQLNSYSPAPVALVTTGSTIPIDSSKSNMFTATIAAAKTLGAMTGLEPGKTLRVFVTQSGGSGTLAYANTIKWRGGTAPTISATDGYTDVLSFFYDGTTIYGDFTQAFR